MVIKIAATLLLILSTMCFAHGLLVGEAIIGPLARMAIAISVLCLEEYFAKDYSRKEV
jgi:hypothetical protein